MLVTNVLSLSMVESDLTLDIRWVSPTEAKDLLNAAGRIHSVIQSRPVARVVSSELGLAVTNAQRTSVYLRPGDEAIVAAYQGPKLGESDTTLPPGARMRFAHVITVQWEGEQ